MTTERFYARAGVYFSHAKPFLFIKPGVTMSYDEVMIDDIKADLDHLDAAALRSIREFIAARKICNAQRRLAGCG